MHVIHEGEVGGEKVENTEEEKPAEEEGTISMCIAMEVTTSHLLLSIFGLCTETAFDYTN